MKRHTVSFIKVYLVLFCMGAFMLISCGKPGDKLVGTWISPDSGEWIAFRKDGTFSGNLLKYSGGADHPIGTYFIDGAKLSLSPAGDYPMSCQYKISGDKLIITYIQGGRLKLDGSMAKYKRMMKQSSQKEVRP